MKNAYLYISAHNGLAYQTYGTGTTIIDENALLEINQTNYSGDYATWYSYGIITLNKGASLSIINNYDEISSKNYNIFFKGEKSGIKLYDPKKVILYNSVANIINADSSATFNFEFNRINLFENAISITDNISKDNCPTYSWYKTNQISYISGTFTNTKTTITKSNYTEEEMKLLPSLDNFNLLKKKILSIGTLSLNINSITDKDTIITGIAETYSSILMQYDNVSVVIQADEAGNFSYSCASPFVAKTNITFTGKAYEDLLYCTKKVEIVYSGELIIDTATKQFQFNVYAINEEPILCPRLTDLCIVVVDSRINSSDWKLYASIKHELKSSDGKTLKDSLVFVDALGNISVLSNTPTLVYTGKKNEGKITTTKIRWEKKEGILLQLVEPLMNNVYYDSEIIWHIEE